MKTGMGQHQVRGERVGSPAFIGTCLPIVEDALKAPENKAALKLLSDLDPNIDDESVIDRLLVLLCPDLLPRMLAHYANAGPRLVDLKTPDVLSHLDVALAAFVPWLTSVAPAVRRDAVRLNERPNAIIRGLVAPIAEAIAGRLTPDR